MILFQSLALLLVAISGTLVVFARDPVSQTVGISFFGLVLAAMFMVFQAPDVALSQIVIGTVGLPLMILLALARMKRNEQQRQEKRDAKPAAGGGK
jgi:uncharacterized MnhB-related membrane protein